MSTSLVLLSDQMALQRSVDIIANNVANASTTGFKREGIEFNTLLSNLGKGKPTAFVMDRSTYRDATAGTIASTGNPLDLAVQGAGYFQVQTSKGTQYTRDGAFRLDSQGQIVTMTGQPVLSDAGQPITLPEESTDITISGDGFITAQVGTGSTRAQLGKIGVVKFDNDQKMTSIGGNMLTTGQTPTPVTGNAIVQGAIEESNVKPISEMTDLIRIQRAYEQATNMISNENTRISNALDKLSQATA
jgi:flagellar basal-body rod protein FlgF